MPVSENLHERRPNRLQRTATIGRFAWAAGFVAGGLVACGGGGESGTGSGPGTATGSRVASYAVVQPAAAHLYPVNPAATWKPLLGDLDGMQGPVSVIDLSAVVATGSALAGTRLTVQTVGAYDATANAASSQWLANVSAVFVDAQGVIVPPVAGPEALAPAYVRECAGSTPATDPVAGDFLIPTAAPAILVVPPGAAFLRVSVDDCFFADNRSAPSDPLRIFVRAETP